jgi:hypothetical protein
MELNGEVSKGVFIVTAILVFILFATAFFLSYEALRDVALDNGIEQGQAWLWPLGLDAFMAVASLYMLWAHLNKEWEPLPLALVMVAMAASVVFNVVHAPVHSLARAVAALPPLVAFMAFEVFIIMVRHYTDRATELHALEDLRTEHARLSAQVEQEKEELEQLRARQRSTRARTRVLDEQASELKRTVRELEQYDGDPVALRRAQIQERMEQATNGDKPTKTALAQQYGVSRTTIDRDLAALDIEL